MTRYPSASRERGVITIFITMMMLLLITALVTTAHTLSTINLRAVGNVQTRNEALAAANLVIEQVVGSGDLFTQTPEPSVGNTVDINNDGKADYVVDLATPVCVRATRSDSSTASSVTLQGMSQGTSWNTIWELDATATEEATGTKIRVKQGVRVLLSSARKEAVCA